MWKALLKPVSRRERLFWLMGAAIIVPVLALLWLQYRTLLDLRAKTRAAIENDLRQSLQKLSNDTEQRLMALTRETLYRLDDEALRAWREDTVKRDFAALLKAHPEISHVFAYSDFSTDGQDHYALWDGQAWRDGIAKNQSPEFEEGSPEEGLMVAFYSSQTARRAQGQNVEVLFGHGASESFPFEGDDANALYVFRVVKMDSERATLVGMSLRKDFVQQTLLPQLFAQALQTAGTDAQTQGLTLAALKANQQSFYATGVAPRAYEISIPFAPVFPRWQLAASYRTNNIAELAQRSHLQSLFLNGFALAALLAGLALTWRMLNRELKLAQEKSAFVANVSHELKTPLALIQMFAETLQAGRARTPAKAQEYYDILVNESRRLTTLINNILDFSAIEAGRQEYQFATGDLAALVRDTLDGYQPYLQSAGFTLTAKLADDLPPMQIDRNALAQALLNLLSNAVKYASDDKTIYVELARQNAHVMLVVKDRGIGIAKTEQQKIFEKFYRVGNDLVHNVRGTGLGLALVRHIVAAHRGTITVESEPGQGSAFMIFLLIEGR